MIKIGDFAKLFDVSIKTIRFYEEKGLLVPNYIDVYSGYRYYDEDNISTMSKILFLKNLGLSIKEIKYFDENKIDSKIKDYENSIKRLYKNIDTLKSLSNLDEGRDVDMKMFINDENAIGKWKFIGLSKTKEDFLNKKYLDLEDDFFSIKEIYLLPKGEEYWVISWTKGTIYICGRPNPYEIENDLMFVKYISPIDKDDYKIIVYEKIDSMEHKIEDIEIKDDINIEFIKDEDAVGFWKSVDFVNNIEVFNPNKKFWKGSMFLEKLYISPDGTLNISTSNGKTKNSKYTRNYIVNLCCEDTLSKYEIRIIDDHKYLIVEWKSGDYIYGKMINGYYVLEKLD